VLVTNDSLVALATLLNRRNEIDESIAAIIDRPMTSGHAGEWIAAQIFDLELEGNAAMPA
jgi:hypothetical protein